MNICLAVKRDLAGEGSAPRGTLTITAPVVAGEQVLQPLIDEYMNMFPDVCLAAAEQRLLAWCGKGPLAGRKAWLCDFSNGGAMAAHLLIRHPRSFLGAALLASPLVHPPWPSRALAGKPVFYADGGDGDTVVSRELYKTAEMYLADRSAAHLTLRRYAAGHEINASMVRDLTSWFASVRAGAETCSAPAGGGGCEGDA